MTTRAPVLDKCRQCNNKAIEPFAGHCSITCLEKSATWKPGARIHQFRQRAAIYALKRVRAQIVQES